MQCFSTVVSSGAARQRVERQGGASGYNCCLPTIPSTDRHVPWLMLIIMIVMVTIMNLMVNMVGLVWFYEEVVVGFVLCSFCASFFFHCIFLHCIYCVCTPKSKALGLYIFIKSLGLYALNGNGVMGHWDQYITLH